MQKIGGHRFSNEESWVQYWNNMAATKTKPRSLDAICAKLKRINNDSPGPDTSPKLPSVNDDESNNNVDLPSSVFNGKHLELDEDTNSNCDSLLDLRDNMSCGVPSSTSRRKRKSAVPRNINQVRDKIDQIDEFNSKDELAEYALNNQNTNFPPENESEDSESLESELCNSKNDISSDSGVVVENSIKSIDVATAVAAASAVREADRKPNAPSPSYNSKKHSRKASYPKSSLLTNAPLDLSMSGSSGRDQMLDSDIDGPEDLSLSAENLSKTADLSETAEHLSRPAELSNKNTDGIIKSPIASGLKDYAESTMNELLQMYGFSGNSDRQGQMNNFTPNQLLQSTVSQGKDIAKVLTAISQRNGVTNSVDMKGVYSSFVNSSPKIQTEGRSNFILLIIDKIMPLFYLACTGLS